MLDLKRCKCAGEIFWKSLGGNSEKGKIKHKIMFSVVWKFFSGYDWTRLALARLNLSFDHQNMVPGTFSVSLPSRFQECWSDTFAWRKQAVGYWLAREWHHWTSPTSKPDTQHPASLNTSISVQRVNNSDWLLNMAGSARKNTPWTVTDQKPRITALELRGGRGIPSTYGVCRTRIQGACSQD